MKKCKKIWTCQVFIAFKNDTRRTPSHSLQFLFSIFTHLFIFLLGVTIMLSILFWFNMQGLPPHQTPVVRIMKGGVHIVHCWIDHNVSSNVQPVPVVISDSSFLFITASGEITIYKIVCCNTVRYSVLEFGLLYMYLLSSMNYTQSEPTEGRRPFFKPLQAVQARLFNSNYCSMWICKVLDQNYSLTLREGVSS